MNCRPRHYQWRALPLSYGGTRTEVPVYAIVNIARQVVVLLSQLVFFTPKVYLVLETSNRITWQMINKINKQKTAKKFNDNGNRASRKARQGEALRENLLKRKAQKRGRLKKT